MDEELAVLCNVQSELELQALRGVLDEAEIPYIVRGAYVAGYSGLFEVYAGHYAALLVHATDYYRAGRRLDDWRELLSADGDEPPAAAEALSAQERTTRHWSRLNRIGGDAVTALVMLLAWPVLLVDEWRRARLEAEPGPAAVSRVADELDAAPR